MSDNPVNVLQQWGKENKLAHVTLNPEGSTLTLRDDDNGDDNDGNGGVSIPAADKVTVVHGDKTCDYTLASMFLQILDPAQGLVKYRGACKKYAVKDPVKASDKATVVGFFLPAEEAEGAAAAPPVAVPAAAAAPAATSAPAADTTATATADATEPSTAVEPAATQEPAVDVAPPAEKKAEKPHRHHDKDKEKHHRSSSSRDKDKHHRSSSSRDKDKDHHHKDRDKQHRHRDHDHHHNKRPRSSTEKPQAPKKRKLIDTEQLFSNLITVVDKRSAAKAKQENDQLVQALSPEGFSVTPDLLSQFRDASQAIVQNEIPVGNSASILKAAAGKDLSRILKLYMDTMQQPSKTSSTRSNNHNHNNIPTSTSSSTQTKVWRPYLVGKKPIIVVPSGMTAPITLLNAHDFFAKSMYVTRDVVMKKGTNKANLPTTFSRRVTQRLGGGTVDYELMDNPKSKLNTSKDWDRVVAVVASGQAWQFKDWPGHYSNPVRLFTSVFGFSVGMEGAKVPEELKGWACVQAKLNRDKRGLDSVTHAAFWNGLDEFMAIHKPELLPQPEN